MKTLEEYECVWRRRVGREWHSQLSNGQFQSFVDELVATQHAFFGHATTLRDALTTETPEALLEKFGAGTTRARASLHVARAMLALRHREVALRLATRGLELAGDGPTTLVAELRAVLAEHAALGSSTGR